MTIYVNQNPHTIEPITLFELLNEMGYAVKTGIAVAVNWAVVPRNQWDSYVLQPEDKITIITATQGG